MCHRRNIEAMLNVKLVDEYDGFGNLDPEADALYYRVEDPLGVPNDDSGGLQLAIFKDDTWTPTYQS